MSLTFRASGHLSRFNIQAHQNETHLWPWGSAINFVHSVSISLTNTSSPSPPLSSPTPFFYFKLQMHLVGLEPKISPSILLLQGEEVPFEL